ncbi:putative ABC transport system permease protein [Roseivirga pacifica]|uniref:Putative ABC transport system permease protein n=1 Tax=Roseivirga pacifica TaxID=1267423 RepID=A0A1I0MZ73_9BACT|nr:ABC transporter permease [Roseivirga pacifica]RKQ50815.1 putative ABC transport system permease protein [Roseivirga pacifica]SEV94110.1 putative ABC transport system permease protein [Roseivirga pacifica]
MLKISLTHAFRHLFKHRFFSSLNIFGLALGLSATLWLVLFLKNELTFDQHHPNHDRAYRISHIMSAPGVEFNTAYSASELPPMLMEEFPEIESFARFVNVGETEITRDNEKFTQDQVFYTDQGAFDIFNIDLVAGNSAEALSSPGSVIIAKSVNDRLFGNRLGLNETLKIDGQQLQVTGIFKDLPENSHFQFKVLMAGIRDRGFAMVDGVFNSEVLWNADCLNYVLFSEGFSEDNFRKKFEAFNEKYYMPFGNQIQGNHVLRLQKLADIHYDQTPIDDDFAKGNPTNLIVFSAIGLSILLLACINYINLATSQAGLRAKEIGIRKVLGSNINALRLSLILESLIQVVFAYLLSIAAVWALIEHSPFQNWLGVNFSFTLFQNPELLGLSLIVVLATGIISGLYPAIYIAKIRPVKALKGTWVAGKGGSMLRKSLVLMQFVISIGVLTATLLMKDQISFLQQKNMGFDQDQILLVNMRDSVAQANFQVLKNKLEQSPSIEGVTTSNFVPVEGIGQMVFRVEKNGKMEQQEFKYIHGGADYLTTLGIELAEGRFYDKNLNSGNQQFVINQTAAKLLGWNDPIGKKMGFFHQEEPGQVIGVLKDFNFFSLHNPIEPLVIVFNPSPGRHMIVRFNQNSEPQTIAAIEEVWNEAVPNYPLDYRFLNQSLKAQYESDATQNKLIGFMTALCIVISLIGLTGLTAFNVNQKRKEIGIRKVLGAMSTQIVSLIYSSTLKLILLAGLIALPLTYLVMQSWYANFEYRTSLNIGLMVLGVIMAVILTFVLVGSLVLNTARKNPTESLRHE